jgi:hypothetical protein
MQNRQVAQKSPQKASQKASQARVEAAASEPIDDGPRKWLSVPDAGRIYYGLSRNGSYDAAERGEIPTVRVGRLLKVPVQMMEQKLNEAGAVQPRPHKRAAA